MIFGQSLEMADYVDEAHRIVDVAIENACKRLLEEPSLQNKENDKDFHQNGNDNLAAKEASDTYLNELGKIDSKTFAQIPNITWMSIGDFTVDSGLNKIEEFIEVCMVYCIMMYPNRVLKCIRNRNFDLSSQMAIA